MSLREQVLKGGVYLVIRQGLGLIIGLGGVMLLTRLIGPGNYGLYASALGIAGYIGSLAGLGVNVYIVRRESEPDIQVYHQAFTLMFLTGAAGLLLGVAAIPLLQSWFQNPAFVPPLLIILLALPVTTMVGPPMARLERELNYRAVAVVELVGQLIYYVVALVLAFKGSGVWAPVIGYLVWQTYMLIGACIAARLFPRPYWSGAIFREMVSYAIGYTASIWIWQLRTLVNPLLVGRYAGAEGVGCVALTIRIVEVLSFVKGAAWRLSIAALAKLQGDYSRLKRAMEEAVTLQVLALGPVLAAFAVLAPKLLPALFGEGWDAVLIIYPFVSLSYLVNAVFNMHSSVLYVLRLNREVALFHMVHVLLFAGSVLFLLPRFGVFGYGWAEVSALLSYVVIHLQVRRLFNVSYAKAVPWAISFLAPLFATILTLPRGLILWIPLLITLAMPGPRGKLSEYGEILRIKE